MRYFKDEPIIKRKKRKIKKITTICRRCLKKKTVNRYCNKCKEAMNA